MLFNSPEFVVFLPIAFLIYWRIPNQYRWILLLIANSIFYMCAGVKYILVLAVVVLVSFYGAILIEKAGKYKKTLLTLTVCMCIGILVYFKYWNFLISSLRSATEVLGTELPNLMVNVILPVGISFYIFQSVGYVVDVYRGKYCAEHHLGYYALFSSFFPQILAGPIGRADQLIPQYKKEHKFNYDTAVYGMKLMMWGFFKKTVIADNLAYRINLVYKDVTAVSGGALLFAVLLASIELYCDFSGYTDIARGVAKLFDIELMENFKVPFLSTSIRELWKRWHISLSTWIRDYIYIPLGGNRKGKVRKNINLLIAFAISGLWHGANWTFLIWGLIHGLAQIAEAPIKIKSKTLRIILVYLTFSFALIFFNADSIQNAAYIITHLFDGLRMPRMYVRYAIIDMGFISVFDFVWHMAVYLIPLFIFDYFSLKMDIISWTATLKPVVRHSIYIVLIISICLLHSYGEVSFVYFQF